MEEVANSESVTSNRVLFGLRYTEDEFATDELTFLDPARFTPSDDLDETTGRVKLTNEYLNEDTMVYVCLTKVI